MLRTSECVSKMHPDKLCDQISDAILDECLKQDPNARVAVEAMGGHGIITVTGELTTTAYVDVPACVHSVVGLKYGVQVNLVRQSPEIASGVDTGGAGDQGVMVGYACTDTPELMPLEYVLARNLCKALYEKWPADGKTQITINEDKKVVSTVVSWSGVNKKELLDFVTDTNWGGDIEFEEGNYVYVNPAGDWNISGFDADTGLTGRKIVIDAYGPRCAVGGGAFSGKDPSKVDRSGAYMARKMAVDFLKEIRNNGVDATECRVELAYAIGKAEPLQVMVYIDGLEMDNAIADVGRYDLTPKGIIKFLDLKKPQYEELARFGHFGNNNLWDK